jgi:hypothetical protein
VLVLVLVLVLMLVLACRKGSGYGMLCSLTACLMSTRKGAGLLSLGAALLVQDRPGQGGQDGHGAAAAAAAYLRLDPLFDWGQTAARCANR